MIERFSTSVLALQEAPMRLITSDADRAAPTNPLPAWATEGWGLWAAGGIAAAVLLLAVVTARRIARARPLAERAFDDLCRRLRLPKADRAMILLAASSDARTLGKPAGVLLSRAALSRALQTQLDGSPSEDQLKHVAALFVKLTDVQTRATRST